VRDNREQNDKIQFPEMRLLRIDFPSILVLFDKDDLFLVLHHVVRVETDPRPTVHVYHYHESESRPRARIAQPSPSSLLRRMS